MMMSKAMRARRLLGVALVPLLAACGGSDGDEPSGAAQTTATSGRAAGALSAQVASYDLVAGRPQRVIVGLLTDGQRLVGYGTIQMSFAYLGTKEKPLGTPRQGPSVEGDFRPIPGHQEPSPKPVAPTLVEGGAAGVYGANDVTFDDAGVWEVRVTAVVDRVEKQARSAFQVLAESAIPAVGDAAPRSQNKLVGAAGTPPTAIDSRATKDGSVPDAHLHATTVADAVASGQPTMVVVSTPVYCVSRFCGPITDTVADLAKANENKMKFVHLEVWRNFEGKEINESAAQWIYPTKTEDATEPWVWVIGKDGMITHRFDNVATTAELERAVAEVTA